MEVENNMASRKTDPQYKRTKSFGNCKGNKEETESIIDRHTKSFEFYVLEDHIYKASTKGREGICVLP